MDSFEGGFISFLECINLGVLGFICRCSAKKEVLIFNRRYYWNKIKLLEPCAGELACTVLRGGKSARIYLSRSCINRWVW
jgi:hypothetical protein